MKIAIIDDQKEFHSILKVKFRALKMDSMEVFSFLNVYDMEESKIDFELIFLDIYMPEVNGIEYARDNRDKRIVFVTGDRQLMQKTHGPNIYGFIDKSGNNKEFKETVLRAIDEVSKLQFITLKLKDGFQRFLVNQIVYLQYIGDRNVGFVYNGESYIAKGIKLHELKDLLGDGFIYIDRSTLVNKKKIYGVKNRKLILNDILTEFKINSKKAKEIRLFLGQIGYM